MFGHHGPGRMKRPDRPGGAAGLVVAAVVAVALAFAAPARADYEAGRKAWDAGDPAAALAEWRAAADAGDRRAMLALGRLRLQGLGAPQNYVEAHKWFNLAASRGAMEAVEERDALAARMTPAQVAAAQERAAAWRPGGASPEAETAAAAAPPASDAGPPPPRAIREAQERLALLALLGGKKLVGMARAEAAEDRREAGSRWADGETFRECDVCPEMVVVPAGSFMMGSPSSEEGRDDDEGPVHPVTIAEPFAVGVYEVTRGEFARFVSATGHDTGSSCWTWESGEGKLRSGRNWRSPGFSQTDRDPVVCVSWDDARAYVAWLSEKTGEEYRLLSESEWEYAARAGTTTRYSWGESASGQCRYANGADGSTGFDWAVECDDGYARTSPVGSFAANGWGLHDVHGNVWEWVEDCWNGSYAGAPSDGRAWGSGECGRRVLRGGSWLSDPRDLRSAFRSWYDSGDRFDCYGFRVARTLAP